MQTPPTTAMEKEVPHASSHCTVLTDRYLNRGTAFTMAERRALGITAHLPAAVETLEEQVRRVHGQLQLLEKPINRYQLLAGLHAVNTTLYYATILAHLEELLPIIYTPTVGEACQKYGNYFFRERGMYINKTHRGMMARLMREMHYTTVDVIVITDGSRILGLGDLGSNGMGISIGKSSLYVAGAGVDPRHVVPVLLDVGTNNPHYLNDDPHYLGLREPRIGDAEYYALLDEFMEAVTEVWPTAVVQFEDFSNNHCFDILARYQSRYRCFNDDIQGTGAVVAAGFLNAVKLSKRHPRDHRIVVFGAGSAAVGVALHIAELTARLYPELTVEDVVRTFYLVDTKGLVAHARGDALAAHKLRLARSDVAGDVVATLTSLEAVVHFVKPTALLGLGGVGPVFTETIVTHVGRYCERPIIFPLSNPTSRSEVNPADAYAWTGGRAIVASGSPYPESVVDGVRLKPAQGNNLYVFPGVGLGCAMAQPSHIPDALLVAASACLNQMVSAEELATTGNLYPPLATIHDISANIAAAVILEAQRLRLNANTDLPTTREELLPVIRESMWRPVYGGELPVVIEP